MPKAVHSNSKGLVQSSGAGFGVAGTDGGTGLYTFAKEVDLEGTTPGADKLHMKSICTLPAHSLITRIYIMCSEDIAPNIATLSIDLALISDAVAAGSSLENDVVELVGAGDIKNANRGDHFEVAFSGGTSSSIRDIGSAALNVLIRNGASNTGTILTAGKFVVVIEFIGTGPATDLTTL